MPLSIRPAQPALVSPLYNGAAAAAAWGAVNRAVFMRFYLPIASPFRYLNWVCGTQSGNVQLGVVSLSGTDRTTYTRVMNSGVIACPAAGNIRTDLGLTLLQSGDYAMFLWADNTTFQTRTSTASGNQALRFHGIASSLVSGVGTSGTLSWDVALVNLSLEADV